MRPFGHNVRIADSGSVQPTLWLARSCFLQYSAGNLSCVFAYHWLLAELTSQ